MSPTVDAGSQAAVIAHITRVARAHVIGAAISVSRARVGALSGGGAEGRGSQHGEQRERNSGHGAVWGGHARINEWASKGGRKDARN